MRALLQGLRAGVDHALIRPVLEGRPQLRGVPLALRMALWISLLLSLLLLVIFLVSYYAFDAEQQITIVDRSPVWFAPVLTGWTFTFAFGLAPLLGRIGRVIAWLILGIGLVPLLASIFTLTDTWLLGPPLAVIAVLGVGLLILGQIRGLRLPGGWGHVTATMGGVICCFVLPVSLWLTFPEGAGLATAVMNAYTTLLLLLAVPMLIAGALTFIQVSIEVTYWSVLGFHRHADRRASVILLVALALFGAATQTVRVIRAPASASELAATIALLVGGTAVIELFVLAARGRQPAERPYPSTLMHHFGGWVWIWAMTIFIGALLAMVTGTDWVLPLCMVPVGILGGVRAIRARRPAAAAVHACVACMTSWMTMSLAVDLPRVHESVQTLALVALIVAISAGSAARGKLTDTRLLAATIAMALVALFPFRRILLEPLKLLGETTVGVVLVGVLWLAATSAGGTRDPSTRIRALVWHGLLVVGTATTIVVNPLTISTLSGFDNAEAHVARLMVPAVLVCLWQVWRFGLDPTETLRDRAPSGGALTPSRVSPPR